MKAILIDAAGFKKEVMMNEKVHAYRMMRYDKVDYSTIKPNDLVKVDQLIFYYAREFWDEDDNHILIYKENI